MIGLKNRRHRAALAALLCAAAAALSGCARGAKDSAATGASPNSTSSPGEPLSLRELESPAGADAREPELSVGADGRLVLSWVERTGEKTYALRFATREGGGWSAPGRVAEGSDWFVNWADFPSVVHLGGGALGAHWLRKSGAGTYAYDVNLSRSEDGGRTWREPVVPHTDGTQTEHGFVSLLPLADGRLGAVWVDGRNLKNIEEGHDDHGPLPASMTLRYAAVGADGRLTDEAVLDERICECCQTSAALTAEGAVVVYRDRSEREARDIYAVRRTGGGWSEPRAVHADNWEIKGCPVNGPSVAADGRRVAVAWFTGAGGEARVNVALSTDAGAGFAPPVRVDDGEAVGRVDVALLADGSALVSWMAGTGEGGANKVRRVAADGALGPVAVVARSSVSRSSGFPRMARLGDEVYFAWTEFGKPSRVRVAAASVATYR